MVLIFLAGEALIRVYWLLGGRWGYTACDRTHVVHPSDGCGAAQVAELPFWSGWGALGLCVLLAGVVLWKPPAVVLWTVAAGLATAAFPLHLLFEIPAGLAGRPTDWRDVTARLALLAGAVLFARLAPRPARGPSAYRPVAPWVRRSAYVAVAIPLVGWALPHALWALDVPFGISGAELDDIQRNLSLGSALAITAVPPVAGLLALGLAQRWGQQFPRWVPVVGDRSVPRLLALVPAGAVAIALIAYGGLSTGVLVRSLLDGSRNWSDVVDGWAVVLTLVVFVGWGAALAVTAVGYHRATRAPSAS
ncbi:hypothetical protein [Cryptosporangium arvum]|uniref:Uncharacterized protein n=1 Tax=Cryptosporangium arvum DSM 44712 TaxID=927661 RepID=A0A010YJV1_9ACTN|nr:hypothetical protein [Cryptosporangium arvum]EXG80525.1 hypothetical protein CryarDRAFT_1605 [Cryptosporangium arvum DSM 44712]